MLTIRPLHSDDPLDDLLALSRTFFGEYEAHHPDFFKIDRLDDRQVAGYFTSFRQRPDRQAILALNGEHIVGYVTVYVAAQEDFWQIKRTGHISGLMVQPEYRRRGLAARLLAAAQEFFAAQAVRYYTVYTAVENRAALAFYEQNGLAPLYTTMLGEITPLPSR